MAYLTKNDLVIIRNGDSTLQARVVDMQFRRFRKSWKDTKTGETKSKWKSVPYAVCECFIGAPVGTEFVIPGYKLKNETKDGEKLLVLRDKYAAEFNGEWVKKMLAESKEKRA
tara:strand:+ start:1368 stop:1706 length:339 start_codon:yes stop_codon:yes gene_type:complete